MASRKVVVRDTVQNKTVRHSACLRACSVLNGSNIPSVFHFRRGQPAVSGADIANCTPRTSFASM
eukprot:2360126-Rhodomonas_salina.2